MKEEEDDDDDDDNDNDDDDDDLARKTSHGLRQGCSLRVALRCALKRVARKRHTGGG